MCPHEFWLSLNAKKMFAMDRDIVAYRLEIVGSRVIYHPVRVNESGPDGIYYLRDGAYYNLKNDMTYKILGTELETLNDILARSELYYV